MNLLLFLFIVNLFSPAFAQAQQITGTVVDKDGITQPGVSIVVKGTKKATSTSVNGTFSIPAKQGDVLVFTSISFVTQELTVTDKTNYRVQMVDASTNLKEIVVVGYGTSSRKTLSSAVTTVKPEELNKGAIADVGQLLQGKVPGLNISASGDPNKPAAIVLRGASTINGSQGPFYVIDNVPGADIATVAPDDIASIDILKDAAATAIYGNRAANGVIMVTTKRGKRGQAQVTYSGYAGSETIAGELEMMDATQLRDFLAKNNLAFTPADDKGANTSWQKAVQKDNAFSHNHNISLSGGSEHSTYNASLNYLKKEGILLNSDLTRVIGRLNVEQTAIKDKVKFGVNISNSNSNADDLPYRNVVLLQSALYLPVNPIKNEDGTYFENLVKSNYYNPVSMINNSEMNTKTNMLVGSFYSQVKLPFGFKYDINVSYQNTHYLYGSYLNSYFTKNYNNMYDNPDPGFAGHGLQAFGTNGQASRSSYQDTKKILETFLTWDKKVNDHTINAVVGYSYQNNVFGNGFQVTTSNFPVDNLSYNNLAYSNPAGYKNGLYFGGDRAYQKTLLISSFARLNYNFKDKYMFQGSLRRDGSSVFGENNRWGLFPAASAAWRISQEDFMKSQNVFSDLKVRYSYGVTGNASGFDAYASQFLFGSAGTFYYNGNGLYQAIGAYQAENANLKWEKTATSNIGIDFSVLNNRVNVSVDAYKKLTSDMIFNYQADRMQISTGSILANGGNMENKGFEVSLGVNPVKTKDLNWNSSINIAHNKNKITKLKSESFIGGDSTRVSFPEGAGQSGASLQLLKEGYPVGQFFTLQYAGKNSNGISQYIDKNGALTIAPTTADYKYLGSAQPKVLFGWSNSLTYKNFDFNLFVRGVLGSKVFNATRADLFRPATAMSANILVDAANESKDDVNAYRYSSRFIENASYVKIDNATLGYKVKVKTSYIKSIRVYASANNIHTFTKYSGVDPEVNQGGIAPGVDYNNFYPRTRTFLMGANVSF